MTFMWNIYGTKNLKNQKNKWLIFFFGNRFDSRKKKWREIARQYFSGYKFTEMGDVLFLQNHPYVSFVEPKDDFIKIHFNDHFLPYLNEFIETFFPDETVGISLSNSGCVVTKQNERIISIQKDGLELFGNGLDQLKNRIYPI